MNRRQHLVTLAAAPAALAYGAEPTSAIQLHVDLEVDPGRETELVAAYRKSFRPVISKQPGFVDVKLLKIDEGAAAKAPANCRYRLLISFRTEEQRKKWVASADHQQAWPTIERTLKGSKYTALLYHVV